MKRLLFFGLLLLLVINSSGLKGHFRFSFSSNKQHKISFTKFAARTVIPPSNLAPDLPKTVFTYILSTQLGKKVLQILPAKLVTFLAAIYPLELVLFVVFQLAHRRVLKFAHSSQSIVWQLLALGTPYEWNKSILGFAGNNMNESY